MLWTIPILKENLAAPPLYERLPKFCLLANTQQFKFNCHKLSNFIQFVSLSLSEEFTQLVLNLVFRLLFLDFFINTYIYYRANQIIESLLFNYDFTLWIEKAHFL